MNKRLVLCMVLFFSFTALRADISLDVKIFTGYSISSLTISPIIGKYTLFENDKMKADILKTELIKFTVIGDSIQIEKSGKIIGVFSTITLSGSGLINSFIIKPIAPLVKEREYDDDLELSVVDGKFLIINHVNLEHYVAGVVQSEGGGSTKESEFFEVQAICCRTYGINNSKKHSNEDFNLCDSTHCQRYLGRCRNPDIQAAAFKTMGDVIVDKQGKMISAAFHANSGGETANSQDVWIIATPYLKSVSDTFSLHMPNATWEKSISQDDWLNYLSTRFDFPIDNPEKKAAAMNFSQEHRQVYFSDSIKLTDIRADMKLKSAFFSIKKSGNNVIFYGKGYGHGVGLSQQGAIRMAQLGYSYIDIIKYYYTDVEIVSYEQVLIRNY